MSENPFLAAGKKAAAGHAKSGGTFELADDELEMPTALPAAAARPSGKPSTMGDAVMRSTGNIIATTGSTFRLGGAKKFGDELAAEHPADVNNLQDVIDKPGQTIKEATGEAIPQMAVTSAGAASGAATGGAIGSLGGPPGAAIGATVGGAIGAFAPNFIQEYGTIHARQVERGEVNELTAVAGGAAAATIDMLGPVVGVAKRIGTGTLKKVGSKGLIELAKKFGVGAAKEGATETVQTGIERGASGDELTGKEAIDDYAVSAAKGAAGGGVMETGGHLASPRAREAEPEAAPAPAAPQQIYDTPAGPRQPAYNAAKPGEQMSLFGSLDDVLDRGIAPVETGGKPAQTSEAGALGQHQLLPSTAKEVAKRLGIEYDADRVLNDPEYNRTLAREHLRGLAQRYNGDMFLAVTAYHAGAGNVDSWVKRFGYDANDPASFVDKVKEVGNPRSAEYPMKVLAAMGQQGFAAAETTDAAPVPDVALDDLSQSALTNLFRRATMDDDGNAAPADKDMVALSAKLSKHLNAADPDAATAVIEREHAKIAREVEKLVAEQNELATKQDKSQNDDDYKAQEQAVLDGKLQKLINRDRVLDASRQLVTQFTQTVGATQQDLFAPPAAAQEAAQLQEQVPAAAEPGVTLVTEPAPGPSLQVEPQPPAMPAADTKLAENLKTEAADTVSANSKARLGVLDRIVGDPGTRNPTRRFLAELAKTGLDGTISPQEAERIARFEDARAAFQDATQPDHYAVASTPDESGDFGIPERKAAAPAPAKPITQDAPAAEPAAPEPQIVERNTRGRVQDHADTLGSSQRAWFLRGADAEMGAVDAVAPQGKSPKARWFEDGREYVRKEMERQARERGVPAVDRAAAKPDVAAKPKAPKAPARPAAAAKKLTVGDTLKAKTAEKREAPEPKRPMVRGGKALFDSAVTKAEQDGKIEPKAGMALRAMADADWSQENWLALDNAIADKAGSKGAAQFSKGLKTLAETAKTGSDARRATREKEEAAERQGRAKLLSNLEGWSEIEAQLIAEMKRLGLGDVNFGMSTRVGIAMQLGIMPGVAGYATVTSENHPVIRVAIDVPIDPKTTLDHEVIHALRTMDLFTPAEWRALQQVIPTAELREWVNKFYSDVSPETQTEEVIAETYARWVAGRVKPVGLGAKALNKIRRFLQALGNVLRGNGYTTAEQVFEDVQSGKIGRRPRGDIRPERGVGSARFRKGEPTPVAKASAGLKVTAAELATKGHLWLASTKDIAAMAKDLLPSAQRFIAMHSRNFALSREFQERIVQVQKEYRDLPGRLRGVGKGTVSSLLEDMVRAGKWGFQPSGYAPKAVVDPALKARFDAMPSEAQRVIQAMLRFNHDARLQLHDRLLKAVDAEYDPLIAAATTPAQTKTLTEEKARASKFASRVFDTREDVPYSPRKREGKYVVVGRSAEYLEAKANDDKKLMDKLREDPDHYVVDFRDTIASAEAFRKNLATKFPADARVYERNKFAETQVGGSELHIAFNQLKELAAENMKLDKGKAAKEIHRMAVDLYLHALADASARKGELKSDNVASTDPVTGEGMDMMRAFVSRGDAMAQYIASVSNNSDMQKAIRAMHTELSATPPEKALAASQFLNELLWHYVHNLGWKPSKGVDAWTKAASFGTLLLKPAYYITNATQAVVLSQPVIAGYLGGNYAKAHQLFGTAYLDWAKMTKGLPVTDRVDMRRAPADVRDALHQLELSGHLDAGLAQELGSWEWDADGGLPNAVNKISTAFRQFPQRIEVMNRVTTGMVAYRAALAKTKDPAQALAYAQKVIDDTHGDYSEFNTPRAITQWGNFGKIALQFQKYHLITLGLLAKQLHAAVKGETPEVKNAARWAFAFTATHMGVLGGAIGLPAAQTIFWAANIVLNAFDDDDDKDYDDWKMKLRAWLGAGGKDTDGDGKVDGRSLWGDLLYKGAPYALLGMDTSQMLGMGDILKPFPFVDTSMTEKDKFQQMIGQIVSGAGGGVLSRAVDGFGFMAEDNPGRAVEALSPRGPADILKARRFKTEGVTARNGDVLIPAEEIGALDGVMLAMGFSPRLVADQQERGSNRFQASAHYDQKTTNLKRRYAAAARQENDEKLSDIRKEWAAIQDARKRDGFKVQPLSTLLKAPKEQAKREKSVVGGVETTATTRGFVESLVDDDELNEETPDR